jgi:hypothetical protein
MVGVEILHYGGHFGTRLTCLHARTAVAERRTRTASPHAGSAQAGTDVGARFDRSWRRTLLSTRSSLDGRSVSTPKASLFQTAPKMPRHQTETQRDEREPLPHRPPAPECCACQPGIGLPESGQSRNRRRASVSPVPPLACLRATSRSPAFWSGEMSHHCDLTIR